MLTKACRGLPLLLTLAMPPATAAPLPAILVKNAPPLSQVGAGEGRKFGFHIYDANLWTRTDQFEAGLKPLSASDIVVLHIEYRRRISCNLLVKAAVNTWKRMTELDPLLWAEWSRRVATLWPDVKPGDSITTLVVPGQETRFYSRDELLGVIDDPAFGPALLAIWLDPRSADKRLRAALIGHQTARLRTATTKIHSISP